MTPETIGARLRLMEEPRNIQGTTHGPIGQCIYCGSDGGEEGLQDEHVVPFSLGGTAELIEASCRSCAGITSYLEGYLARKTFYDLRVATKTQTYRKHPELMPVEIEIGEVRKRVFLASGEHAFFTHLPAWGLPGIMLGKPLTSEFGPAVSHRFWTVPENFRRAIDADATEDVKVIDTTPQPNLRTFGRAIAKIAYCNAVVQFGLAGFHPLFLPDLILGKNPYVPSMVGADLNAPPPPEPRGRMHVVKFNELQIGRLRLLVCELRIFAHSGTEERGMPIYYVIVGREGAVRINSRRIPPRLPRVIVL